MTRVGASPVGTWIRNPSGGHCLRYWFRLPTFFTASPERHLSFLPSRSFDRSGMPGKPIEHRCPDVPAEGRKKEKVRRPGSDMGQPVRRSHVLFTRFATAVDE